MACTNTTTTPPRCLAGFLTTSAIYGLPQHNSNTTQMSCRISFNLWLEPTQQQHHPDVLQDLQTIAMKPNSIKPTL
jgi:hypothetical protein